jgi:hypothetical protein
MGKQKAERQGSSPDVQNYKIQEVEYRCLLLGQALRELLEFF